MTDLPDSIGSEVARAFGKLEVELARERKRADDAEQALKDRVSELCEDYKRGVATAMDEFMAKHRSELKSERQRANTAMLDWRAEYGLADELAAALLAPDNETGPAFYDPKKAAVDKWRKQRGHE